MRYGDAAPEMLFENIWDEDDVKKIVITYDYDYSNEDKKSYLNNIINKSENIFEKINSYKHNKTSFNIILKFIEQLNKNISFEKYIEIIELFIKKYYKGKVIEIKLQERLNNFEFYEKLEDTPLNFISWIFS